MERAQFYRLIITVMLFVIMGLWEFISPRRSRPISRKTRWATNLSLIALDSVIMRFTMGTLPLLVAFWAEKKHHGLLNIFTLPLPLKMILSYLALDFTIYFQHVVFHSIPALWRLHRVHHSDMDLDVSSGLRFHPIELMISSLIKSFVCLGLGADPLTIVIAEAAINAGSMFNHGNVNLPLPLDRILRWFVVTPDMHRVHHSVIERETNSNFSFTLSWWDYLFGTYRSHPMAGQTNMVIGLHEFRDINSLGLFSLLIQPFKGSAGPQSFDGQIRE